MLYVYIKLHIQTCRYLYTYMIQIYQRQEEMLITIIVIISTTGHVIVAIIYPSPK